MENLNIHNYNSYNTPQYSFTGVTSKLSKAIYPHPEEALKDYFSKRIDKKSTVGRLPSFITRKLEKENMPEAIKDILSTFDKVAEEIRDFSYTTFEEWQLGRSQATVNKLRDVLSKYNILSKSDYDNFDLEFLGKGGKGKVFKIVGLKDLEHFDEDDFVIKVFYTKDLGDSYANHGLFSEVNAAAFWMKNIGFDTNRGKFFFGDLNSGYMVNKFIDEDVRLPKRKIDFEKIGFHFTDEDAKMGQNFIREYFYDWGGCTQTVNFLNLKDHVMRRTRNYIMTVPKNKRLKEWLKKFNEVSGNKESVYAGLAQCIPYLPKDVQAQLVKKCIGLNSKRIDSILKNENLVQNFEIVV